MDEDNNQQSEGTQAEKPSEEKPVQTPTSELIVKGLSKGKLQQKGQQKGDNKPRQNQSSGDKD